MCPTSLVITLAQLSRTRDQGLGLREVLDDDLRIVSRLIARSDFGEGVRALLIDKDNQPEWKPRDLSEVKGTDIEQILA